MPDNKDKTPPKGNVRFSISLSEEQKLAKAEILMHPYNFRSEEHKVAKHC